MIRTISLFCLLMGSLVLSAQPPDMDIHGKLFDDEGDLVNASIKVYNAGEVIGQHRTGKDGDFSFELPYGKDYVIEFSKLNYYNKRVDLLASGASVENVSPGQRFGGWEVEIYPQVEGVDASIFDESVGKMYFDESSGYFEWDRKYSREMEKKLTEFEKEYEKSLKKNGRKTSAEIDDGLEKLEKTAKKVEKKKRYSEEEMDKFDSLLVDAYLNLPKEVTEQVIDKGGYVVTERIVKYEHRQSIKFRKVVHEWGGKYYFREGVSISPVQFELQTRTRESITKN